MNLLLRHLDLQIKYREDRLAKMPRVTVFERQNKHSRATKIKIYRQDNTYYTMGVTKPEGVALLKIANERKRCINELAALRAEWNALRRGPVPDISQARSKARRSPYLTPEFFRRAEPYQNFRYPLDETNGILYKGKLYRSKGEVKIATILDELGIEYKYETALGDASNYICPDFLAHSRETDNCAYIEYNGKMDDRLYYDRNTLRRETYFSLGMREGIDVVYITEYQDVTLDDELIKAIILSELES